MAQLQQLLAWYFAGTQDYYLRALDSKTGKEVWKAKLPVAAVAAPLIYKSPKQVSNM